MIRSKLFWFPNLNLLLWCWL